MRMVPSTILLPLWLRCWIVLLCSLTSGWSQTTGSEVAPSFSQRNWARADGLPSNVINSICQDRTGYLWIATPKGLARFDGSRFFGYDLSPGEASQAHEFVAMASDDANDGLFVAPRTGGLGRFSNGRYAEYALPEGYAGQRLAQILVARDGALWLAFEGGEVMRLQAGQHQVFRADEGLGPQRATQLATDGAGRVWVANRAHLLYYEMGSLHAANMEGIVEDIRIASSRHDGPWVLTRGWLYKIVGERPTGKTAISGYFTAQAVQAVLEDSRGVVWAGTRSRGIRRLLFDEQRFDLTVPAPEDVGVLFEDRSGNIWTGSNGGGLMRIRDGAVRTFTKAQGLLESHTLSVCEDASGTIWVADRDGGLAFVNDQGRVRTLNAPKGEKTFSARSVIPTGSNGVWVATSYGLFSASQQGLINSDSEGAPPKAPNHGELRVTYRARNGDLWMALEPGRLALLRAGTWRVFTAADGLGSAALAIDEDPQGRIWIGTSQARVYRFEEDHFVKVPLAAPASAGPVQAIHFDRTGTGWIGTAGAGLLTLDPSSSRNLDDRAGLPTQNITQVVSDDQGNLWFGSPEGIFHVRREELDRFFAGRISRVDAVVIGADEGLGEATCVSVHEPSVWRSRSGMIWFATRQGVVAIDPQREKAADTPLVVKIDAVRAGERNWSTTAAVSVPPLTRTLELDYSVLCLSTPERVRARVRLEGYDDDWTVTDAKGLARYTRLPPGEYRFLVEAHLAGAAQTLTLASVPIVVLAAWWQTLWFRVGAILLVLVTSMVIVRVRSHRRLQARLAQVEHDSALERERARIARNIHDDLGSGLSRISLLIQSDPESDGRAQLARIQNIVSNLTQSMDETVWAVNPKNDDLEGFANYLAEYAQGFLSDAGIRCRIVLPDFLPARAFTSQGRHHLFLTCKEALNNVAKHAHATEVSLKVEASGDELRITISDNGRGFAVNEVTPSAGRRTANGLANMRSRLAAVGGSCEIVSTSQGTVIHLAVPLTRKPL